MSKPCALCGALDPRLRFTKGAYRIVRCTQCGLEYLDHSMDETALRAYYSEGYFTGAADRKGYADYLSDRDYIKRSFTKKLRHLEALHPKGKLLDIGCAAGFFLEAAETRGWDVAGQEISDYAGSIARQTFGQRVFVGPLDGMVVEPGSIDVITMWDVIEHLENPTQVIASVTRWLSPGGILAICTVDSGSWLARLQGKGSRIYNPPQHLYYYSRTSLRRLLAQGGLTIESVGLDVKTMSLEYVAYVQAAQKTNPLTTLGRRRLTGALGRRAVTIPLPDNQVVFARWPLPAMSEPI